MRVDALAFFRTHERRRADALRVRLLRSRARDHRHLASQRPGDLHRHLPESTQPDDAHPRPARRPVPPHRIVHRDSAHHRTGEPRVQPARNRHREPFVDDVSRGVPTLVCSPIGCVRARPNLSFAPYVPTMPLAHICSSPDAHLAHARQLSTTHPTPTASPTVDPRHLGSDRRARPGELVSRTIRILRFRHHPGHVSRGVHDVAVTDAAVAQFDEMSRGPSGRRCARRGTKRHDASSHATHRNGIGSFVGADIASDAMCGASRCAARCADSRTRLVSSRKKRRERRSVRRDATRDASWRGTIRKN